MRIINLYPGSWGANCYLLISGGHCAVVDPSANANEIVSALEAEGVTLDAILLTHGHFDHTVSMDTLRERTGASVWIHSADADLPTDSLKNGFYPFFHMERIHRSPDRVFEDGHVFQLGDEEIRVIHTPGHTQGSVCFLCNESFLLTGDTLFNGDRGRTDLYGGNEEQLLQTLQDMRQLPQSLPIYPGHGIAATLGAALDSAIF